MKSLLICVLSLMVMGTSSVAEELEFNYSNTCFYQVFEKNGQSLLLVSDWGSLDILSNYDDFSSFNIDLKRLRNLCRNELVAVGYQQVPYVRLQIIPQELKPDYLLKIFYSVENGQLEFLAYEMNYSKELVTLKEIKQKVLALVGEEG